MERNGTRSVFGSRRQPHSRPVRGGRSQRGQAVMEMALLLPVLVMIALAGTDFARGISQYVRVVNAATAGAQYGASGSSEAQDLTGMRTAACNDLTGLSCSGITATYSSDDGTSESIGMVKVTVSVPFKPVTPFLNDFLPFTLTDSVTMRVNTLAS